MSNPAEMRDQVLQALERFERLKAERDPALLSEFAEEADVRLVGSEVSEVATGPAEVEALVRRFFGLPVQVRWEWWSPDVSLVGDVAWLFAQGEAVLSGDGTEQRVPYRMIRCAGTSKRHVALAPLSRIRANPGPISDSPVCSWSATAPRR